MMRAPLIQVPRPPDFHPDLVRLIVANALWCEGLHAANPDDRILMADLFGLPPDGGHWPLSVPFRCWQDSAGQWHTEGISTCGLTAEGIQMRSGIDLPWRGQAYHSGTAIAREQAAARAAQLAVDLGQIAYPGRDEPDIAPGDVVVVGRGTTTHELVCVARRGNVVVSVDGGQSAAPDWLQAIRRRERTLARVDGVWCLGRAPLQHWVRSSRMPFSGPCWAPEGWNS